MFVTFEGIDGAGKSTLFNALTESAAAQAALDRLNAVETPVPTKTED